MTVGSIVNTSSVFNSGIVSLDHLTPDGMLLYLESRLGSLDDQINLVIGKQKQSEEGRKSLQKALNLLGACPDEGGEIDARELADCFDDFAQTFGIEASHAIEAMMPEAIRNRIGDNNRDGNWGAGNKKEGKEPFPLSKEDLRAAKAQFENMIKDIESGSELEMIKLQSLMSGRNTAISLSTNMASSMGKGEESIVGNIGR